MIPCLHTHCETGAGPDIPSGSRRASQSPTPSARSCIRCTSTRDHSQNITTSVHGAFGTLPRPPSEDRATATGRRRPLPTSGSRSVPRCRHAGEQRPGRVTTRSSARPPDPSIEGVALTRRRGGCGVPRCPARTAPPCSPRTRPVHAFTGCDCSWRPEVPPWRAPLRVAVGACPAASPGRADPITPPSSRRRRVGLDEIGPR